MDRTTGLSRTRISADRLHVALMLCLGSLKSWDLWDVD